MSYIAVENVHKHYNATSVLRGFTLAVDRHEVACLIGPSGCGKSTVLRCINGLERIDAGDIRVGNITVSEELADTNTLRRRVGIVFQQFNLFPHMTALENVSLGPRQVLGVAKRAAEEQALGLLERVGLAGKAKRYPDALSGGEQQRVAIARTLAMKPEALLLDEITSALDPELVGEVLKVIGDLAREGRTMVLVTHEMKFAREVATHVVYLYNGLVEEEGPPEQIFGAPKSERLKQFIRNIG